jgi:hypothetical protein
LTLLEEALVSSLRVVDPRRVSRDKDCRKAHGGGVAGPRALLVSRQCFEHHVKERLSVKAVLHSVGVLDVNELRLYPVRTVSLMARSSFSNDANSTLMAADVMLADDSVGIAPEALCAGIKSSSQLEFGVRRIAY